MTLLYAALIHQEEQPKSDDPELKKKRKQNHMRRQATKVTKDKT